MEEAKERIYRGENLAKEYGELRRQYGNQMKGGGTRRKRISKHSKHNKRKNKWKKAK